MQAAKKNRTLKKIKNLGSPSNNSKNIKKGGVFFVIKGEKEDGSLYVKDAIKNGARAIVTEDSLEMGTLSEKIPVYIVPNSRIAYAHSCAESFSNPGDKLDLCGITGTNGKTSISYILKKIWEDKKPGLIGTIETTYGKRKILSRLTTPDSYELNKTLKDMCSDKVKKVFLEVSSHSLELSRVDGINFNSAIFSNISRDHLDFHKTINSYYKSKAKLFNYHLKNSKKKNKIAVVNIDDKYGKKIANEIKKDIKVVSYSIKDIAADFYLKESTKTEFGTNLIIKEKTKEYSIDTRLFGNYNFENILASFAFSKTKGLSIKRIHRGIKEFTGAPGRLEEIHSKDFRIFIDYAHTPDALLKSIVSIKKNFKNKKLIVVFGCGGDRDKGKRALMGEIASKHADQVIITSDNPRFEKPIEIIKDIASGIKISEKRKVATITNRARAISFATKSLKTGDLLLITGKGHEQYQDIKGKKNKFSDKVEVKKCLKKIN
jgi:UDP-N-acetylmuramoyl-L-alanyl-D-glutamate--2,6-diaminopimelate ligase